MHIPNKVRERAEFTHAEQISSQASWGYGVKVRWISFPGVALFYSKGNTGLRSPKLRAAC
jgi:hypothetical protein